MRTSCFKYANNFSPTVSFQWVIARSPRFFQGFHESMSVIPEMFLYWFVKNGLVIIIYDI